MNTILKSLLSILVVVIWSSCEKVVEIDLATSASKPVIEGLVADTPGMSYVKLTRSDSYFNVQNLPKISGAQVTITDDQGVVTLFTETSPGYYEPAPGFKGEVQATYQLSVMINGALLTSRSTMRPVTPIENIKTIFYDDNNSEGKEKGYYVYVSFYELPGKGDSYKIDMLVNGKSNVLRPDNLFYLNDKYIDGGHAVDFEFNQKVEKNDTIELLMYSLSPEGYQFYDAIYQIASAGGLFGKNPANIPTNISGDAFGYFGASAISSKTAIVQ